MHTEEDAPKEHQFKSHRLLYPFDKQFNSGEEETEQCFLMDASPTSKDFGDNHVKNAILLDNESDKTMKSLEILEQEEIQIIKVMKPLVNPSFRMSVLEPKEKISTEMSPKLKNEMEKFKQKLLSHLKASQQARHH